MFRSLRTKLTVFYVSLFGGILLLTSLVTYATVSENALHVVSRELTASGTVFDQIWRLRTAQLQNGAGLLSRDFGFRAAVASNDAATISSALDNLKARLGIDLAVTIGADGRMHGAGAPLLAGLRPDTLNAIQSGDGASGIVMLGGTPYELVSAPVTAPVTIGWVVFATKLDRPQMATLEAMAAVPLDARILHREGAGVWRGEPGMRQAATLSRYVDSALRSHATAPGTLEDPAGSAIALVRPLRSLDAAQPLVLVLRYPLARAMAPYQGQFMVLLVTALAGFAALLVGARALARNITKPILALERAANQMEAGELAEVAVGTDDEIGRLAKSFNRMVARIGERDAERARAAETLERARDQAEAANRAKSSFLANMSHDVRTPLNGVLGVAGVLAGSPLNAEQRGMVDIIQNSASVLQRVLNDVLDLAKVEAGQMQIVVETFNLGDTLNAVAGSTALLCKDKGIAFERIVSAPLDLPVLGDRIRLEQVLGNLLSNALKFTAVGSITLDVSVSEAGLTLFEVRDTGIGFDPSMQEALFQPFKQADDSHTRQHGGTGLGLSISRELARAMGGELTGVGRPGEGSTFTLELPLPPGEARAADPAPSRPTVAAATRAADRDDGRPIRILLADDHDINRTVVCMILEPAGAELTCVENGAEAVEAFKAAPFDLVLMDMQMPVMDGLTAIGLIRAHEAASAAVRCPILVLSANTLPEHVTAARSAGADGHVAKPITPPILMDAVANALDPQGEDTTVAFA